MRYLKLFENFGLDEASIEKKIMEIWKVDPYEFKDYITSSMDHGGLYGSCDLSFVLSHPYPDSNSESSPIFNLEDGEWSEGYDFDILDAILKEGRYKIGIEAWVPYADGDHKKIEKFYNYANRVLQTADMPYIAAYPNDALIHEGRVLIEYDYTWGYKEKLMDLVDE